MLAAPLAAFSKQHRLPKIGYVLLPPLTDPPTRERQAFLHGLRELGYVPGKTIDIVYASGEGEADFLDAACADLLKQKVDVIVAAGAVAVLAAQRTTSTVPIVMLAVGDPVAIGAVQSLSRPSGNLTGVSFMSGDLAGKRVQLVTEIRPDARRIAVLWDMRNANARAESTVAIESAAKLGMKAESIGIADEAALKSAFSRIRAVETDALYVVFEGGLVANTRTSIAEFGLRQRIPVISGWTFLTEAGGLLSYGADIPTMFHRAAYYVHRIVKGARPAELPIERPTRFELVINMKTAKALGLTIPPSILVRADRVIE